MSLQAPGDIASAGAIGKTAPAPLAKPIGYPSAPE
jgi:hypothetical protein